MARHLRVQDNESRGEFEEDKRRAENKESGNEKRKIFYNFKNSSLYVLIIENYHYSLTKMSDNQRLAIATTKRRKRRRNKKTES